MTLNKRKILIMMPSMNIGGAERSLISLLDKFDYSQNDVYLFLYQNVGDFISDIPSKVKRLPEIREYQSFETPIKELMCSPFWLYGLSRIVGKIRLRIKRCISKEKFGVWAEMQYLSRSILHMLPKIPGEYDVAISYLGVADVLVHKVSAKKKIAWNHTDYTILYPDKEYDRQLYNKVDNIISVSKPCTEQFLRVYPEFKTKAMTIENVLSDDILLKQANIACLDEKYRGNNLKLLSVGRFCEAKNFDSIPEICKRIREHGIDVKWYLIGYGPDEGLIRSRIEQYGMKDYVIILGKKSNPYPYMLACDYYIQPSRYEGKCVSVIEAQILHKPVIITNYATSSSQLEDGVDGVIVPLEPVECADRIAEIICTPGIRQKLIENTKKKSYSNSGELRKLYSLMIVE